MAAIIPIKVDLSMFSKGFVPTHVEFILSGNSRITMKIPTSSSVPSSPVNTCSPISNRSSIGNRSPMSGFSCPSSPIKSVGSIGSERSTKHVKSLHDRFSQFPYKSHLRMCLENITCAVRVCPYIHLENKDAYMEAILNGSPEVVHDSIREIFEKFPDHYLSIVINSAYVERFSAYQDDCTDGEYCRKKGCGSIHNKDLDFLDTVSRKVLADIPLMKVIFTEK